MTGKRPESAGSSYHCEGADCFWRDDCFMPLKYLSYKENIMKIKKILFRLALVTAATCVSGLTLAADKVDIGKQEYEASCANCHGMKGEGNGEYAQFLKTPVANLTVLSKNNGGVFPVARVYDTIDGRPLITSHGRNMPIWGTRYSTDANNRFWDDYPTDSESFVRSRILALVDYINRLQQK